MTIRNKLMLSFFSVALLIGMLGAYAVYRSIDQTEHAALHESTAVAQTIAALVSEYLDDGGKPVPGDRVEVQDHIERLKELHQRDIVIVDLQKKIIADAVPGEIGTVFNHDAGDEVGKTIADGKLRTFREISAAYPAGIRQIVLPLDNDRGKRAGAVILEYTPLYDEILQMNKRSAGSYLLLYVFALGLSLFIGYRISREISRPLAELQNAALKVAAGDLSVTVEPRSQDELGSLADSFNKMTNGLSWARDRQMRAHEELLAESTLRKKTDEALLQSEVKFRTLFEDAADAIFVMDLEGNFIDVNRTAYTRLGYAKEEMLSLHISQLNDPQFNPALRERFSRIKSEGQAVFESGHRRKDGSFMPVEVNARIVDFGGRTVFFSVIRDITDRKRADDVIRKANTRLRSLIQAIPDMVIFKDRDGRHLLVNRTVEEMTGHAAEEIIGRTAEEIMPPAAAEACRKSDEAALEGPVPIHRDERMILQDGSVRYIDMVKAAMVDDRDQVIGLVAIGRDVTDRKRAEAILRESEEKYRELVESVNSIVLRWSADGVIEFINSFGARFFGYASGELAGQPVLGTIVPESESTGRDLASMTRDICQYPDRYLNNVNENMRRNGRRVWVSWTNKPVVDDEGRLVEILSIGNDITERMHVQDELRRHREELMRLVDERTRELQETNNHLRREIADRERMEQELVKAQKLESLGVLAGGIAHDFNNLLTTVMGNISMALLDVDARHPAYKELARAERAILRAQDLTQQLLTFSKGGAPVRKTASISDLIRETAGFAVRGGRVKCESRLPDDLRLVDMDGGQMSQVIHNLIINADHAMPDGGTITVRGENVRLPVSGGPSLPPGDYVRVSVEDHGMGIPAEYLPKIFDPYFTTKQRGSGLGLATSYSIIQKHGGSITVRSVLGRGTTFELYLPASSASALAAGADTATLQAAAGRVLVMDDEEDVRETAGSVLKRLGYSVALAEDGNQTITMYREAMERGEPFDAVIIDLTVPGGMGGREAVRLLREIDPSVRAIVSSGYSNDPVMAEYEDYGFAGMVSKPYRMKDLGLAVQRVLANDRPEGVRSEP
ncbi:MAG: PAS domain S-box protein [Nitrospirota bacterium]|nr:PAS domain S-box protein [Nitrospirota bacterium]